MRISRFMAVLLCLCFTFAGASALAADKEIKAIKGDKEITVTVDADNFKLKNVKIKDGTMEEVVVSQPIERHGNNVTDLEIKRKNGPADTIQYVPDDTTIISGTGTCVWYFSGGGWHQYCW